MILGTSSELRKKELSAAAKEGMQVYHMIQHNQSFNSMKCTSKMIREVFGEPDFKCSATKAAAITSGVFEPLIVGQIRDELEEAHFVTFSTDASNHKEIKMFPIVIRYFLPNEGVKIRLIELSSLPGETGKQIYDMLHAAWMKWNVRGKTISFCADNAPANFGHIGTNGELNVFTRMQREFNNNLIGIGCLAHILHNTPRNACSSNIPYDFNQILSLIYKQFKSSTKQTEQLKTFCEQMDVEYKKVKSCVNTRFVAKKSSINAVLRVLDPLQAYVKSIPTKTVPMVLRKFFADPLHKFYLVLVRDLCELFEDAILKIEGNEICGNEAVKIIQDLQRKLQKQVDAKYISIEAEQALDDAYEIDSDVDKVDLSENTAQPLYRKFLNSEDKKSNRNI